MKNKISFALLVYSEVGYARDFAANVNRCCPDLCGEILLILTGPRALCLRDEVIPHARCIDAVPSYPGAGRNQARLYARCDMVCIFDAELEIEWRALRDWLQFLLKHGVSGAGVTRHRLEWTNYTAFCYWLWESFHSRRQVRAGYLRILAGASKFFSAVGGFDGTRRAGEDFDFYDRALKQGLTYSVETIGWYCKYPDSLIRAYRKKRLYASFRSDAKALVRRASCLAVVLMTGCALPALFFDKAGVAASVVLSLVLAPMFAILAGSVAGGLAPVTSGRGASNGRDVAEGRSARREG